MLFGRTGGAMFSLVDRQWGTDKDPGVMQKAAIAQDKALGINQMVERGRNTLTGKEIDLHAKWNSLLVQTGEVALPIAVQALSTALPILKGISDFATKSPDLFGGAVRSIPGAWRCVDRRRDCD